MSWLASSSTPAVIAGNCNFTGLIAVRETLFDAIAVRDGKTSIVPVRAEYAAVARGLHHLGESRTASFSPHTSPAHVDNTFRATTSDISVFCRSQETSVRIG